MNKSTKSTATKSEKAVLVEKIKALNAKAKVSESMSREELRVALKKEQGKSTEAKAVKTNSETFKKIEAEAKAKKAAKPEVKAEPAPVVPTPEPTPAPAAPEIVLPKDKPAPEHIELDQEKQGSKRYVSKTDPNSKYHLRDRSDVEKPVAVVRRICEAMGLGAERKAVILACCKEGVNKNTAMTQYSLWKAKKLKEPATSEDGEGSEE